jgi:hypothetical protein
MSDSNETTYMGTALVGGDAGQVKIGDDGCIRHTVSDLGAVNGYAMTITDGETITSGYVQGFYASLTTSSDTAWSTGNTQGNVFATDIALTAGTVACEVEGSYVYISGSSNCTKTSANISGQVVYIDDLGGAPTSRAGIQIHIADGNVGSTQDGAIVVRYEGSSCLGTNLIQVWCPQYVTNFLKTNVTGGFVDTSSRAAATVTRSLVCLINGTTYYIPLLSAS